LRQLVSQIVPPTVHRYEDPDVEPGETYLHDLTVNTERGSAAGVEQARVVLGVEPAGPDGVLLLGSAEGVVRHNPRTGERVEVLAPSGSIELGGVTDMTVAPDGSLAIPSGGSRGPGTTGAPAHTGVRWC
jgi:hypothetical protein